MSIPITQSVIVDPTFHSNKRTEFKLYNKGRFYAPNLRLVDFGVSDIQGNVNPNFCILGGLYSVIKNISLYFNDVLVQQVKDASQYLSIKNAVKSNYTVFRDVNNNIVCSSVVLDRSQENQAQLKLIKGTSKLTGVLYLNQVFSLLDTMNSAKLNLADINEIRVSIEYETDVNKIFSSEDLPQGFSISQPSIIYTEFFNLTGPTDFKLAVQSVENERFIVQPNNNKQSIRVRAFDGKTVANIICQNLPNNQVSNLLGYQYSQKLEGEKVNLMVNSAMMLPFQGVDNEAKKLVWTSKSMGNHFSPLLSAMENFNLNAFQAVYDDRLAELASKLSYLSVDLNKKIDRIDYEVSWDGQGQNNTTVYVYGHVEKIISKQGDMIRSMYA
jgi:hypothetical protein